MPIHLVAQPLSPRMARPRRLMRSLRAVKLRIMDDDVLARARAGDRDALEQLLARHKGVLERVARHEMGPVLRARVRTSDVLQSTYLEVLGSLPNFRGDDEQAFVSWVARILQNNIRDAGKFFKAGKRSWENETSREVDADQLSRKQPTPSAQAALSDELMLVGRALRGLSSDYQRVLTLRMQRDLPHAELAKLMDRSEGAVRVLLSRARAALLLELDRLRHDG